MSEALKKYHALLAEIKAEKGYKPNMGAAGKTLLAACVLEAKQSSKKADKSRPKRRSTFSSLDKKIYKCAGLSEDACTVAPHCFYQPNAKPKRCMLRSGKDVVSTFDNPKREAVLAQLTDEYGPHGRAYPLHPLYDIEREQAYINQNRNFRLDRLQSAGSPKTVAQIAAQERERAQAQERARAQAQERARAQAQAQAQAQERARVQAQARAQVQARERAQDINIALGNEIRQDNGVHEIPEYDNPWEQHGQMNDDDIAQHQADLNREQMMQRGVAHIREYNQHF